MDGEEVIRREEQEVMLQSLRDIYLGICRAEYGKEPGQRLYTFAYPGGGNISNRHQGLLDLRTEIQELNRAEMARRQAYDMAHNMALTLPTATTDPADPISEDNNIPIPVYTHVPPGNEIDDVIMEQETLRAYQPEPVKVTKTGEKKPTVVSRRKLIENFVEAQVGEIEDIVSSIYPGENYEIRTEQDVSYTASWMECVGKGETCTALVYFIELYFPEIRLKNSEEGEHKVFDVFVRLAFDIRITSVSSSKVQGTREFHSYMRGMRTSQSNRENAVAYEHSHLRAHEPGEWGTFCLGTSPLSYDLVDLKTMFDKRKLEIILLSVPVFLQWESLEGTPYQSMKKMYDKGMAIVPVPPERRKDIVHYAMRHGLRPEMLHLEAAINNNKIEPDLEKSCTEVTRLLKDACLLLLSYTEKAAYLYGSRSVQYNHSLVKGNIKEIPGAYSFREKEFRLHTYDLIQPEDKKDEEKQEKPGEFELPDNIRQEFCDGILKIISDKTPGWLLRQRSRGKRKYLGV